VWLKKVRTHDMVRITVFPFTLWSNRNNCYQCLNFYTWSRLLRQPSRWTALTRAAVLARVHGPQCGVFQLTESSGAL
jgi:hypothetical protein